MRNVYVPAANPVTFIGIMRDVASTGVPAKVCCAVSTISAIAQLPSASLLNVTFIAASPAQGSAMVMLVGVAGFGWIVKVLTTAALSQPRADSGRARKVYVPAAQPFVLTVKLNGAATVRVCSAILPSTLQKIFAASVAV